MKTGEKERRKKKQISKMNKQTKKLIKTIFSYKNRTKKRGKIKN